jgi:integrase
MTNDTGIIFPARGQPNKPFNGWSKSKAALDMSSAVSDWTLHDLRRTFATRLAELRTPPHIIERLLNHVTGQISGVAAIYNRASYMQEMREAVEKWEKYLASVLASEAPQIRAA